MKFAEFEQWRLALQEGGQASTATTKRIQKLERELARKEYGPSGDRAQTGLELGHHITTYRCAGLVSLSLSNYGRLEPSDSRLADRY